MSTWVDNELESALVSILSKKMVVAEFRGGEEYKRGVIKSRLDAGATYHRSEEFEEELKGVVDQGIANFRSSTEYAEELRRGREVGIAEYRKSTAYKEAAGAEAGKVSM